MLARFNGLDGRAPGGDGSEQYGSSGLRKRIAAGAIGRQPRDRFMPQVMEGDAVDVA